MKRIAIVLNLLGWTTLAPAQPNPCTQEMVVGTYAFAYEGYVMLTPADSEQAVPVPEAGLALAAIDSQGVISSTAYQGIGGLPGRTSMPGTIQVNPDCTGTVDWGKGVTGNLVVLREGEEMHSMMTASVGPPIVSGRWKRVSRVPNTVDPAQCSPKDVVGSYVAEMHGFAMSFVPGSSQASAVPVAAVTAGSFTSNGRVSAGGIRTVGGQTNSITVDTRFTTGSDCTFRLAPLNAPPDLWGVVLDGGNELWSIGLTSYLGTERLWRITKLP